MNELFAFIIGIVIGVITSIPPGPINLAIIFRAASNKTATAISISVASAFMDVLYCSAAIFGIGSIIETESIKIFLQIIVIVIFFVFGIKSFFVGLPKQDFTEDDVQIKKGNQLKRNFLLGIVLYISNPLYIPYWVFIASIMHGYKVIENDSMSSLSFALGTGVGNFLLLFVIVQLIERFKVSFPVEKFNKFTKILGIILIILSIYLLIKFLFLNKIF